MPDFKRAEVSPVPLGDTPAYPGERERHTVRRTGAVVIILDADIDRPWLSEEGGRWVTLCEDHGYYANHPSLATARGWYSQPDSWCPDCATLVRRGRRVPPR